MEQINLFQEKKEVSNPSEFPNLNNLKRNTARIIHNSGNSERYTPAYIIQLARKTMDDIV